MHPPTARSRCPERESFCRFLDEALPLDQAQWLEQHLLDCLNCQALLAQVQADTARRVGTLPSAPRVRPIIDFLEPPADANELGRLGPYRILRLLGAGGMGMVFEAEDITLQRRVALKTLKPELAVDPSFRERFLREARAAASIPHDHIVTIYQVGQANDVPFLAMQFLQGRNLEDHFLEVRRLELNQVLRIGREMAEGLAAAHAQGLIHRDIKPANVWLEFNQAQQSPTIASRVKILDFGLARRVSGARLTETGMIVGTPGYMSPEQARGQEVDHRSDIFSLGCVLYWMLTGSIPFEGTDTMAALSALALNEPRPIHDLNPNVPADLVSLINQMLAKDRANRPSSARLVVDCLQALEQGQSSSQTGRPSFGRRASREAERRQVTVLACGCDLFQSEAFLDCLDSEGQDQLLRAYQKAGADAVRRYDGTVVLCNEQGFLACFGYPVAHEDAARRAARTGLAILADLNALGEHVRREHKLELNAWVGLHTGQAVVEAKPDAISLVGEARSVAVRLEDVSAPGQVICTEATYRLFQGGFQCTRLGHLKMKGVAQPIQLFRVDQSSASGGLIDSSAPAELSPLTGRDHEISLLKDRWEQAQEGMGQIVLLIGEPGLGKSRLVHTLKEHVLGQMAEDEVDAPVIEWRCSPQFQNTGLYPAIDFYERALSFGREESAAARFDRLVHRLEQYDLVRPETVPLWASLLSLPTTDRYPPLALSPVRQREETFRAMLEWLHVRAARKPVLFIVEDLHWVDASTLEFLEQLLADSQNDCILTVLTFRPEFNTPWQPFPHQTRLTLPRLTRRQVGDLMRKRTGGDLPDTLVEQIYTRAGGVPLFVEEFTKMVQESSAPAEAGKGSTATPTLSARAIPATLQDLVMARLDRIQGERELAQLAATLGREFGPELLAAAAGVDEVTIEAQLAKLVRAEILSKKGRPPRTTYVFKHALLEDALYNALVKGKRQQFHQAAAEALEAQFPQTAETQPELLAYHFTEAGLTEKAIDYWLKAGTRSRERSAEIEAISHLTRGLALLATLDESPKRDAQELKLLAPLGTAYIASHGYAAPEVGPVFQRARQLCELTEQPRQLFAIILGIWEWHTVRGELRLCMNLAAEGMAFADRLNDPGMLMEALFMAGETLIYRADFAGARDRFATAVTDYDDRDRTSFWAAHTSHNAGVTCRSNLAVCLWHLGKPDQALKVNREMCQLAREIDHPYSLAYALHHTAWLRQYCRLGDEVRAVAEETITIAAEQGFALWKATGTFFKGAGMLLQGEPEAALPLLLKAIDDFRASGAELTLPCQLSTLGQAYIQTGRFADARRSLDEGLVIAEKNDERFQEAELVRLKGELLLAEAADQAAAAENLFGRAIETAQRQQSKAWELRATMSLARLWHKQGRSDEARAALAAMYSTYTEGFTMPDLMDAKALLESMAS